MEPITSCNVRQRSNKKIVIYILFTTLLQCERGLAARQNRIGEFEPNFIERIVYMGIAGSRYGCIRKYFDIGGQQYADRF